MNVYDFDGTIYPSDCMIGFAFFVMKHHPTMYFTYLPKALTALMRSKKGELPFYKMVRTVYRYLMIDDFDELIEKYWDKNFSRICPWYLAQKKPDDLIISASPDCIIAPVAKRLGVNFVATEYDREFGVFLNNLMYAREKARYIIDKGFPMIENFYSDSLADAPLALCAEKAHLVTEKGTKVIDWPVHDPETMEKIRRKINTGWSIHLDWDEERKE